MKNDTTQTEREVENVAPHLLELHFLYDRELGTKTSNLSTGECGVLYCLSKSDQVYCAGDLAESLSLSSGRIANILKTLENKQLISRCRCTGDKRKIQVSLTPKGRSLMQEILDELHHIYRFIVKTLGEKDSREYIRLSQRLLDAYEEFANAQLAKANLNTNKL